MITPTKRALIHEELAMLFAEKGLETIPDLAALLDLTPRPLYCGDRATFDKAFGNWGNMLDILKQEYPDLMKLAEPTAKPKPAAKPAAKPATKPAVKKGK